MKHRFIVFVLLFTLVLFTLSISPVSSQVNDNDNDNELSKGVRPVELSDFPIDWFELNYRNYTDTEIFELSILPLIEPEDINNKEIRDSINLMDRVLLKEVSEQEIEATYGNIYIKKYLFENETELDRFRSCVFKCPNMFRNTYYKDNIMYDIDYDDRRDFESLAEILALDNIEIVKLNFGNYPLPFSFTMEWEINIKSEFPLDYYLTRVKRVFKQRFDYNDEDIFIYYYLIEDFNINEFDKLIEENPDRNFFIFRNVLIEIIGEYSDIKIDFPATAYSAKDRKEKLDS